MTLYDENGYTENALRRLFEVWLGNPTGVLTYDPFECPFCSKPMRGPICPHCGKNLGLIPTGEFDMGPEAE